MHEDGFEERLWAAMDMHGFESYGDVERASGISHNTVSSWAVGRSRPSMPTLARLLEAMPAVDARWLVTGRSGNGR